MSTALGRAIDSLTDPSVSLADALRGLLVVARRIDADALSTWLKSELEGYDDGTPLPEYRTFGLPILVHFDGPMGRSDSLRLYADDLPEDLGGAAKAAPFRQPVAELVALSAGDADPALQLPPWWVGRYRTYAEQDQVPRIEWFVANSARMSVGRTVLLGMLDRIKSVALDLALGLEDVSAEVGDAGGPTVDTEPALREAVASHMTMILANNSTVSVASGQGATAVQLQVGDVDGLLEAAGSLLSEAGVDSLRTALVADGGEPGETTRGFLGRVRGGAVGLAAGIASNGAYDGLVAMLAAVFPSFT